MKYFTYTILIFTLCYSCSKNQTAKDLFEDNIWFVDSIKIRNTSHLNEGRIAYPNTILKPKKDSSFALYKEQTIRYKKYYFSNDTIFLKKRYLGRIENNSLFKYVPYKYVFSNENLTLITLDKLEKEDTINLTKLTKLFEGKNDVKNSDLFENLKTEAWYPIKYQLNDSVMFENKNPNYYITKNSFIVRGNKLNTPYYPNEDSSFVYKLSKEHLYIYDTNKKELMQSFRLNKFEEMGVDMLKLTGFNGLVYIHITLKKIDRTLLINEKDLPKKVRLGCEDFLAEWQLSNWLQENNDYDFYYDLKTLNLTRKDDDNCIYFFNVIWRSKEFHDIASKKNIKVEYLDDGNIQFESI